MDNVCRTFDTPVGTLLAVEQGGELTELNFIDDSRDDFSDDKDTPLLRAVGVWLNDYFAGRVPTEHIPLHPSGTPFQHEIWQMLLAIPHGSVVTYGDLADEYVRRHGGRMSAQAVGGAVGKNPILIIVPCHRVIGANGCLTGFGGGLNRKLHLLETEGADTSKLYFPAKTTGRASR